MLASELKLAENNVNAIMVLLRRLETIRNTTGYGTITLEVQSGMVVSGKTAIKDKVQST
ncbi:MAG: hypothetical protein PHQ43_12875 [Dehalococcoidales bacterium]|jgi:hypothetical protein|nr:hypothetical protein [Dehalococcoidales bacterium]